MATDAKAPNFISDRVLPNLKPGRPVEMSEKMSAPDSSPLRLEIDPALDRALTRKFDTHLVPWLFGLWLLAFIDRSNIGNARIDGLSTDLGLTGHKFNIVDYHLWLKVWNTLMREIQALTVFYIPYILVDVPSNWVLKVGKIIAQWLPANRDSILVLGVICQRSWSAGALLACVRKQYMLLRWVLTD